MSEYQVLYRKYRPETLDDVVGREYIIKALRNAIKNNSLAHAYLFTGPRGTGKTSLARIFAREIQNNVGDEDIIEIDAASNNGVDEIRNLVDRIKFAPLKSKYKVYIIDEVHMMTTGAFNAFLKTIEEPPEHVIFILATTEPHKVIETILSRCQRYDFKSFNNNEIITRLKYICECENITIDELSLNEIAKLSNGGMRDALSILDQLSTYSEKNIKIEDVENLYGTISNQTKRELILNLLSNDKKTAIEFVEKEITVKNVDYKILIQDLIEILKNYLIDNYYVTKYNQIIKIIDEFVEMLSKMAYIKNLSNYFEIVILKILSRDNNSNSNKNLVELNKEETKELTEDKNKIVSRETNEKKFDQITTAVKEVVTTNTQLVDEKQIDYELMLRLLVGADAETRKNFVKTIQFKLNELFLNIEYIPYCTIIKNGEIIAASQKYIIMAFTDQVQVEQLTTIYETLPFYKFTQQLFGTPKKIFGITQKQRKQLIEQFVDRRSEKTLPEKIEIQLPVIEQEESSMDKMKKIFKEELIIK